MKKLVAKTKIGTEYMHSREDAFFASANAQQIADALNGVKYKLRDGEKWHVYDYDIGMDMYVYRRIYKSRNGSVKVALL